jgi:hypothetical protein
MNKEKIERNFESKDRKGTRKKKNNKEKLNYFDFKLIKGKIERKQERIKKKNVIQIKEQKRM